MQDSFATAQWRSARSAKTIDVRTTLLVFMSLAVSMVAGGAMARAQSVEGREAAFSEVVLKDGTVLRGHIVEDTASSIVLDHSILGRLEIERENVRTVHYPTDREGLSRTADWRQDPDYNSLLFLPTSETLQRGDSYYRNFELLFNNLGVAVHDSFNLSFAAAFPITSQVRIFIAGAKLRVVSRESYPIGLAVSGTAFLVDEEKLYSVSCIVSFGNRRHSATVSLSRAFSDQDDEYVLMLGGDAQLGPGFKLLVEYGNSRSALLEDEEFKGIINIGFRAFWENVSFTLTALRPLEESGDDFIAFPVAMFSAHF